MVPHQVEKVLLGFLGGAPWRSWRTRILRILCLKSLGSIVYTWAASPKTPPQSIHKWGVYGFGMLNNNVASYIHKR